MKGLLTAVMLAALMSDLESIFNSAGTLFTIDIWKKVRPAASQTELVFVGKIIGLYEKSNSELYTLFQWWF